VSPSPSKERGKKKKDTKCYNIPYRGAVQNKMRPKVDVSVLPALVGVIPI